MKIAKIGLGSLMLTAMLMTGVATAQAQIVRETVITGTVFGPDGTPVNSGSVSVQCGTASLATQSRPDGTYGVTFSQNNCKVGDTAAASASTPEGSGSDSEVVQNSVVNGPIVDIDIAVIDITVPEFGLVGGMITAIGAVGTYMYMKTKALI